MGLELQPSPPPPQPLPSTLRPDQPNPDQGGNQQDLQDDRRADVDPGALASANYIALNPNSPGSELQSQTGSAPLDLQPGAVREVMYGNSGAQARMENSWLTEPNGQTLVAGNFPTPQPTSRPTPAPAPRVDAAEALRQAAAISSQINTWSGWAGTLHAGMTRNLDQGRLPNTQWGVDTALRQRADLTVGRQMVSRGFDQTTQQITRLLNNPIVQKDAALVGRLQNQLRTALQLKGDALKPYDASIRHLNQFLSRNQPLLANLSKASKAYAAIGDTLVVVGGVTNGFSVAANSPATTQTGKVIDGVLAGAVNAAFGKTPTMGPIGAVDAITGQNVANTLNGVVAGTVLFAEMILTNDTRGYSNFAAKAQKGDYGAFLQAGNAAGNAIVSLENPATRERFVQDAAAGNYGPFAQFGNALGEGLANLYLGVSDQAPRSLRLSTPIPLRAPF
jgi:hypothetical protein